MGGKLLIFSIAGLAAAIFLGLIIWSFWNSYSSIKKAKENDEIQKARFMANIKQSEFLNEQKPDVQKIQINYGVKQTNDSNLQEPSKKKSLFDDEDENVIEEIPVVTGKLSDFMKH